VACELKVEAPAGAKPEEMAEGVPVVVDGVQEIIDWRVSSKQRAEVDVEDECWVVGVDKGVEEELEETDGGGENTVEEVCLPTDDEVVDEDTRIVDVTITGKGGLVTVVVGIARDTEPEPSGLTVTVSVSVVVELQVVFIPASVAFALDANPGEANPTVVLAAARLDMA